MREGHREVVPCNLGKKKNDFTCKQNERANIKREVYKKKNKKTREENTGRV